MPLLLGADYFDGILMHRRQLMLRAICEDYAETLNNKENGCVVLMHPTTLTQRLHFFSDKEKHVQKCIDVLLGIVLNPTAMFVAFMERFFSGVDAVLDGLSIDTILRLERFFRDALLEIEQYGWTPVARYDDCRNTP